MKFMGITRTLALASCLISCSSSKFDAISDSNVGSKTPENITRDQNSGRKDASSDASSKGKRKHSADSSNGRNDNHSDDDSSACTQKGPTNAATFKITGSHPAESIELSGSSHIFVRGNSSSVTATTKAVGTESTIEYVSINIAGNTGHVVLNLDNTTKIKELCVWSRGNSPATIINVKAGSSVEKATIDVNGNDSVVSIKGADQDDCSNVLDGNGRATVTCTSNP